RRPPLRAARASYFGIDGLSRRFSLTLRGRGFARNGEHERSAWSVIALYPETTMRSLDYRAADRQSDTQPAALGRVERIEQLVHGLRLDADTGIPHGHAHTIPAFSFGSDQ